MISQIKKIILYLLGKTSELCDMGTKDVHLAKTVLYIHRKSSHAKFIIVPLSTLKQIHAIDRANAVRVTEERAHKLQEVKKKLVKQKNITREVLAEYLPSISWIKVVKQADGAYIAYEGNGRLAAMQKVFSAADGVNVEVEEYYFRNPSKIIRRMEKIRKLNGFID